MKIEKFSDKQIEVLTWWINHPNYDSIICNGAIRSGKTFCLGISFIFWSFCNFNNDFFAICGKTIKSVRRNFLNPILPLLQKFGFKYTFKMSENTLTLFYKKRVNVFYLFGGKDESSSSLIQGLTLSGVLFDEVALMPRSFVEQAIARCSDPNSKFWFNCNPEGPYHWFYKNWILRYKEKNSLLINFLMSDNPSLSSKIISRYKRLYSGTFYERFINGKWTSQVGLVYPFMTNMDNFCSVPNSHFSEFVVSCDYGIINPTSCGMWGKLDDVWYRIDEYYYDSKVEGKTKTDEEHYESIKKMIGNKKIKFIIIDPSASSMISLINKRNDFKVIKANNNILEGIHSVMNSLRSNKIKICKNCIDSIREFSLYKWDEKKNFDVPTKENDHAMDDIRYFVSTNENLSNYDNDLFIAFSLKR